MGIRLPNLFIEQSPEIKNFADALAKAQASFAPVVKDEKGPYGMFASLNAMISATRPALTANGLSVMQPPMPIIDGKGKAWCITQCTHRTGEWVRCAAETLQFENPQKTMGYFSYIRRMSYGGFFCLASCSDNDGAGLAPDAAASEGVPSTIDDTKQRPAIKLLASRIANCRDVKAAEQIVNELSRLKADGKITADEGQPLMEAAIQKRRSLIGAIKPKARSQDDER